MKAQKILLGAIIALFVLASCDENAMIRQKIQKKKQQIDKLEEQIAELESQLSDTINETHNIPVAIKQLSGEEFLHYIIAYGEVEAEQYASISSEAGGRVQSILVNEGANVYAGQPLIKLNTESVSKQIQQIKSNLDLARETFQRQERLWNQKIGSEIEYLQAKNQVESLEAQLESLQAQQRLSQVTAPFAGYVNDIFVKEGEYAAPGVPVVELVNLSELSVSADLSEEYVGSINKGKVVEVSFPALPGVLIKTPVDRIAKVIDPNTRTFEIEVSFSNKGEKIKPNMISQIRINDFKADSALVVPSIIIKQDISGKYLYIAENKDGQTIASKRYIKPGMAYNELTIIEKGLDYNDMVIVEGYNVVSSGAPVEIR